MMKGSFPQQEMTLWMENLASGNWRLSRSLLKIAYVVRGSLAFLLAPG
jgi:hypothetical protein